MDNTEENMATAREEHERQTRILRDLTQAFKDSSNSQYWAWAAVAFDPLPEESLKQRREAEWDTFSDAVDSPVQGRFLSATRRWNRFKASQDDLLRRFTEDRRAKVAKALQATKTSEHHRGILLGAMRLTEHELHEFIPHARVMSPDEHAQLVQQGRAVVEGKTIDSQQTEQAEQTRNQSSPKGKDPRPQTPQSAKAAQGSSTGGPSTVERRVGSNESPPIVTKIVEAMVQTESNMPESKSSDDEPLSMSRRRHRRHPSGQPQATPEKTATPMNNPNKTSPFKRKKDSPESTDCESTGASGDLQATAVNKEAASEDQIETETVPPARSRSSSASLFVPSREATPTPNTNKTMSVTRSQSWEACVGFEHSPKRRRTRKREQKEAETLSVSSAPELTSPCAAGKVAEKARQDKVPDIAASSPSACNSKAASTAVEGKTTGKRKASDESMANTPVTNVSRPSVQLTLKKTSTPKSWPTNLLFTKPALTSKKVIRKKSGGPRGGSKARIRDQAHAGVPEKEPHVVRPLASFDAQVPAVVQDKESLAVKPLASDEVQAQADVPEKEPRVSTPLAYKVQAQAVPKEPVVVIPLESDGAQAYAVVPEKQPLMARPLVSSDAQAQAAVPEDELPVVRPPESHDAQPSPFEMMPPAKAPEAPMEAVETSFGSSSEKLDKAYQALPQGNAVATNEPIEEAPATMTEEGETVSDVTKALSEADKVAADETELFSGDGLDDDIHEALQFQWENRCMTPFSESDGDDQLPSRYSYAETTATISTRENAPAQAAGTPKEPEAAAWGLPRALPAWGIGREHPSSLASPMSTASSSMPSPTSAPKGPSSWVPKPSLPTDVPVAEAYAPPQHAPLGPSASRALSVTLADRRRTKINPLRDRQSYSQGRQYSQEYRRDSGPSSARDSPRGEHGGRERHSMDYDHWGKCQERIAEKEREKKRQETRRQEEIDRREQEARMHQKKLREEASLSHRLSRRY